MENLQNLISIVKSYRCCLPKVSGEAWLVTKAVQLEDKAHV
jgi:hypothetical protein